jgi:hypothetical protein
LASASWFVVRSFVAYFSGLRLHHFAAERARFVDCDFSRIEVEWLPFFGGASTFVGCNFTGARIADLDRVRLEGCDFSYAKLDGWFTWRADIIGCRFAGPLRRVVFVGHSPDESRRRNDIRGNDFREAEFDDVDFRTGTGIDLDAQLLPSGPEYVRIRSIEIAAQKARAILSAWDDSGRQAEALAAVDRIEKVFAPTSPDVFTTRSFIAEFADDRQLGQEIVGLLTEGPDP